MNLMTDIEKLRKKIDKLDQKIVNNLTKRFELIEKIGKIKKKLKIKITDKKREKEIIQKLLRTSKKYPNEMVDIYIKIIKISKKLQR
mgnify:CR=1 FL=1